MKLRYKILAAIFAISLTSCEKFLDRPPLTTETDMTAWNSEEKVRLYANKYYTDFFVGYGDGFSTGNAPLMSFTNSDDVLVMGNAPNFTRAVPASGIWSMTSLRSINIMHDRVQNQMDDVLTTEAKNHWLGIAKFFRAFRYHQLVLAYGDVPYYDTPVSDTAYNELYKPRDSRDFVMDKVYDDLMFAFENVRLSDGDQYVNRYVVAGFITRFALFEGAWQKYYYNNNERAKKFFELAVQAGDFLINSGRYTVNTEYRTLFTSESLAGNTDVILYRNYDAAVGVTHSIASNSNFEDTRLNGPTTDLLKAYLINDGNVWQNSDVEGAKSFDIENMVKTRDPRFEATFYSDIEPKNRASYIYVNKFLPRSVEKMVKIDGLPVPSEYKSNYNSTDYPVLRFSEILLNWIEAKAELEALGAGSLTQEDINKSINVIRQRPVHADAKAKGVTNLPNMELGVYPNDPNRDPSVAPLIWEIRRERRLEFTFEYSRLEDLKRWKKLDYMDTDQNPDLLSGGWVNFPVQVPGVLVPANSGLWTVMKIDGSQVIYNGSNSAAMVGFFRHASNAGRQPFVNQFNINPYLAPVGKNQIDDYAAKGYSLQQTEGWPQN